ncbi:MAG: universal stress protein [Dehalococcoidales bacterium]|jgi:nucleotide-binding universal stress UspA family protein
MSYQKILVPLDGSVVAEAALAYAGLIASRNKAELALLTVCDLDNETTTRPRQAYLEQKAEELRAEGLKVSTAVVCGNTVEQIAVYALRNQIDLLTISSRGYSGFKRLLLGSVAGKVIDYVKIPILLVKAGKAGKEKSELKRVLLPMDGSQFSETSVPYAQSVIGGTDAEMVLLTVAKPPLVPSDRSANIKPSWEEYRDALVAEAKEQATDYLERVKTAFADKKVSVKLLVEMGQPAESIMRAAKRERVHLIALSSHGRTGAERVFYGSVARQLIDESRVPLLLIRPGDTRP